MKNTLFATTALVALGFAGSAFAADPISLSVGGYMGVGVGISDNVSGDDVGILRDGEIHFKAKGSSDNGLTFEARVELEAFGTSDQIDENYVRVSGSFGSVMIGGNDTAKNNLTTGVFYAPLALGGYYDHIARVGNGYSGINQAGDQPGIHYNTPNFNGLQAAISYQPEGSADGGNDVQYSQNDGSDGDNVWSFGVNYLGDFDGFSFRVSGGYETADGDDQDTWSVGAQGGTGGFMLGVYYEDNPGAGDTADLAIGGTYSTGPWTVGAGYATVLDDNNDPWRVGGWATYAMAPGVSATLSLEHGDTSATGSATSGLAYIALNF
jgi:outer membrane protein OmpU